MTRFILALLSIYKRLLSPLLGNRCRFHPSCSDYARASVARFGPARGSLLALWRIARCQPMCAGGPDPVPETFTMRRCGDAPSDFTKKERDS
ncbi:MAG: membrane protein insertion efficiency factor YidD [Rudaea sp.]